MTTNRQKPLVGQKVILVYLPSYWSKEKKLKEVTVTEVGRKYFRVDYPKYSDIKFRIEDWGQHTEYNLQYELYSSLEELDKEILRRSAIQLLKEIFDYYMFHNFSVEQLNAACIALGLSSELSQKYNKQKEVYYEGANE